MTGHTTDTGTKEKSQREGAWSDAGAPFPSATFSYTHLLWFLVIIFVAKMSIEALNNRDHRISLFWISYECYIVFDHVPFLSTRTVYKSPGFNYRYVNLIFFWGMEAAACIVATQSNVGAPSSCLYNAAPHIYFVGAYMNQAATSKAFLPSEMKTWWVRLQVVVDNVIHLICLWFHVKFFSTEFELDCIMCPLLTWTTLVCLMILLTVMVHRDEMSWKNLQDYFKLT